VSMDPWLDRLGELSPAERRSWVCGSPAWQALGAQACGMNIVQGCVGLGGVAQWMEIVWVCISSTAGLGGVYWQSRDLAGLCRPWRCGGQSRDRAGLGVQSSQMELLQGCAGLGGLAQLNGNHACLYLQHGWSWCVARQSRDGAGLCRPGGGVAWRRS
jgi:hypothetical protein